MSKLRIAVQKSGRLNQDSMKLLKDIGISIDNGKDQLKASAKGFPVEVFYLRNGDIPQYLKDGVVDAAIIGENVLIEKGEGINVVEKLGFSSCRVCIAVPKADQYNSMKDLAGKRIATSYPNTVKMFLNEHGVEANLHIINGSVEIAPNIGLADAICDIVSSGSTLFKNNLKEVDTILKSEAVLAVSPKLNSERQTILETIQFRIQSVLKGRNSKYVLLNAPNDKVQDIIDVLPGMKSPTVLPLAQEGWSSVHSVISKNQFWDVIDDLKAKGAQGILVCPIEKWFFNALGMQIINNPNKESWSKILKRPTQTVDDIEDTVNQVFNEVSVRGDVAIKEYTNKFDGVSLESQVVTVKEITQAINEVPLKLQNAIKLAKQNIEVFHTGQKTSKVAIETTNGVQCWQEKRPIQKVGLYIPGGTAPLFSTVLMLAIPAQIAGCKEIVLCSPPNKEGKLAPEILFAAQLCGVTKIIKVGGIQAIAGLTFGTETIPQVFKIFGPGNQFVTVAKQIATKYGVAIDMPAGPSELLVVADETANAAYIASDLLSQAEHGTDSQVILVATSEALINEVSNQVAKQIEVLPRKAIAEKAIANSKLIYIENDSVALELIDEYGPEHFIICSKNEDLYVNGISNAGSVFIGDYTPESAGDYASGTNHTLPTNGFSKAYSGVNLDSFTKSMTFQKISKEGLLKIGETIELMAEAEGLQAHKNAVTIRLKDLK